MKWTTEQLRAAMRVYAVTDGAWLNGRSLASCVEEAIAGGATFVQLRDKGPGSTHETTLALGRDVQAICRAASVPFVIDDDVQAAVEVGADGVHVGQSDAACRTARELLGPDAIVGVSVQTLEQALQAQADGASYLGVGAMYATSTKTDALVVSRQELAAICKGVSIPVVAIGGLNVNTLGILRNTGVDGVAVVSALFAADDIAFAARELDAALEEAGI